MRAVLCVGLLLEACGAGAPQTGAVTEAVRVCPAGAVTEGIDVSVYQGNIDWQRVKAAGIEFAYIRVSDGLPPIDSKFVQNWSGARAAGVLRGVYQFFREDEDAVAQADLLLDTMGPLEADDLPPAIDVESTDGQTGPTIVAHVSAWMDRIEAATGRTPIIYTGRPFWDTNTGSSTAVNDRPLWIPNWGVTCPSISAAWSSWAVWQYSSTGSVDGISGDVDLDRFNGDRPGLVAWTGVAVPDASVPIPDAPVRSPDAAVSSNPPDAPVAARNDGEVGSGCQVASGGPWGSAAIPILLMAARFPRRRSRDRITWP